MLYLSSLQSTFDRHHFDSVPEAERERIASELLELVNHIPSACVSRPDLSSTIVDPENPDWIVLDVDELPGPNTFH